MQYRSLLSKGALFSQAVKLFHITMVNTEYSNEVGRELDRANLAWMAQGNGDEHAQRVWRYWVRNHLTTMGLHTHNWVSRWTIAMERNWGLRSGTMAKQVVEAARKLKDADTTINQDDID